MPIFRFLLTSVCCALCLNAGSVGISSLDAERALSLLDSELAHRDFYLRKKQSGLDSLRNMLSKPGVAQSARASEIMLALGNGYTAYNNDSALWYFDHGIRSARRHGLDSLETVLTLRQSTLLPLAGFSAEADSMFCRVDTTGMSRTLKALYFGAGRQMYSYMASFFRNYPDMFERYNSLSDGFQARLITVTDEDDPLYRLNVGEYHYIHGEYAKASAILTGLLKDIDDGSNIYARATHMLSGVARARGDHDEQIYYLARSAVADIRSATLEVTSLQQLGMLLFDSGNVSRANEYLTAALENAVNCHASLRVIETSEAMPVITSAHNMETERNRTLLVGILCVLVLLLVGMGILLLFLRRDMRRMHQLQENLRAANKVKEVYISQFLNLCSIYMDKLNNFCKIANRKITTGKVDDLLKMTKSGKFVEEQSREFYDVFDDAFLHLYPTFMADVNALLRPDEQIELKDSERMNTDLRILAFMRLGIEESTRIAQVLNYSVYTIYTYRNKLKNRAINRETFEADVMRIGALG